MSDIDFLRVLFLCSAVAFAAPAGAYQINMSITGSHELGGNIAITCSWTLSPGEVLDSVILQPLPAALGAFNHIYYFRQGVTFPLSGTQHNDRMSYDRFNPSDQRAVVRITNLQCSDEKNYSCYFSIVNNWIYIGDSMQSFLAVGGTFG